MTGREAGGPQGTLSTPASLAPASSSSRVLAGKGSCSEPRPGASAL